jgi:hypothetical protein
LCAPGCNIGLHPFHAVQFDVAQAGVRGIGGQFGA